MATLKIGGRSVTVDDAFLRMTPDQQNAAVEEIAGSLGPEAPSSQPAPAQMQMQAEPYQPAPQMVDEYDAMGNRTGGMVAAPAPVTMGYGEQMANVGSLADKGVRMAANGATFGMADRLAGTMGATGDFIMGNGFNYGKNVEAERARTQAVRDEAPVLAGIAEGAGGLAGGLGLIKNGVTLAGRAAGSGLAPRIGLFGLEGALYGGASGAGNTYSSNSQDYIDNAISGGKTGLLIGGGLPLAGAGASSLYRIAKALTGDSVAGVNRAGSAALRAAAQADEAGLRNLTNLGPEAMLPDAGPSMLGLAQGAATGNGPGKSQLVNALRERDAGTAERLGQVVDSALGPAPIPSQVDAGIVASRRALSPSYEKALDGAKAVDTRPLADHIEALIPDSRGPVRAALEQVRSDLNIPGNAGHLDPSPRALLNVRHSIDDALESAPSKVQGVLGDIRRRVDAELTTRVPGIKAVDAQYAELSRQREALEMGQTIFDTGRGNVIRPIELTEALTARSPGQGEMVKQGARAELDRVVGTNINDLNALEKTLATPRDWNNQKARIVFGDDAVEQVTDALTTNRTFRNTMQKVVEGSRTAPTSAAAKSLEAGDGPGLDVTVTGLATSSLRAIAKALMGTASQATKEQVATVMANPRYADLADALLRGAQRTNQGAAAISRAFGQPAYLGASAPANGRK